MQPVTPCPEDGHLQRHRKVGDSLVCLKNEFDMNEIETPLIVDLQNCVVKIKNEKT